MKKVILSCALLFSVFSMHGQNKIWRTANVSSFDLPSRLENVESPAGFTLNFTQFKNKLLNAPQRDFSRSSIPEEVIISIPVGKAQFESFKVIEAPNFSEGLAEKYPHITAFRGKSLKNPSKTISISMAKTYLKINIFTASENHRIIPINEEENSYLFFNQENAKILEGFKCLTQANQDSNQPQNTTTADTDDMTLRTYQLAVATDAEFTNYFGSVSNTLAGINDILTQVNVIYERDLAVHLELVANNDAIIFTDSFNDPFEYSGQFQNNLNEATQNVMTDSIGATNYDIGILFSGLAAGGNAGCIGCICLNGVKGSGYAGARRGNQLVPESFYYTLIVSHEMGHQLGANHTHSRTEQTGVNVEPGSGTTIMGYAGITIVADVQSMPDDEFHYESIRQISNNLQSSNCGTTESISNNPPIVDAGQDYTIPHGTPFKLTATATNVDQDELTFSWEEIDSDDQVTGGFPSFSYPSKNSTYLPSFRVYPPDDNPAQYFPPKEQVLYESLFGTWNMIPVVGRELNFAVQVRDNSALGGQTASDKMKINVSGAKGPFQITSINKNDSFEKGAEINLEWDVAGTTTGDIGVSNVKILISTDGGESFSTLVSSTANDGQKQITLPNSIVTEAFIKIEAIGNIFYTASPIFSVGKTGYQECDTYVGNITNGTISSQQPVIVPINVNDPGTIENLSLKLSISNANLENLFIILRPPNGLSAQRIYIGNCSSSTMNVEFNSSGESIVDHCGNLTNQILIDPPLANFDALNGQSRVGTWQLVILAVALNSNQVGGGQLNFAKLQFCQREISTLGVEDHTKKKQVKVYPNPSKGKVNLSLSPSLQGSANVMVYSLTGRKVYSKRVDNANSLNNRPLQLQQLSTGVYFVKIQTDGKEFVKKIIIE